MMYCETGLGFSSSLFFSLLKFSQLGWRLPWLWFWLLRRIWNSLFFCLFFLVCCCYVSFCSVFIIISYLILRSLLMHLSHTYALHLFISLFFLFCPVLHAIHLNITAILAGIQFLCLLPRFIPHILSGIRIKMNEQEIKWNKEWEKCNAFFSLPACIKAKQSAWQKKFQI